VTTIRKERGEPEIELPRALWRKSTYSGGNGSCVEVADLGPVTAVRDSKDPDGPKLIFAADRWRNFISDAKAGAYDL